MEQGGIRKGEEGLNVSNIFFFYELCKNVSAVKQKFWLNELGRMNVCLLISIEWFGKISFTFLGGVGIIILKRLQVDGKFNLYSPLTS